MRSVLAAGTVIVSSLIAGCAAPQPTYTQAQITAIETREVDATLADTYNAASSALFDAGYTIAMSDRMGGLITGRRGEDKSNERAWVSPYIRDTEFVVSILMRETGPRRTTARIKTAVNGEQRIDEAAIDEIWVLMQRQVLMTEPPATPAAPALSPKTGTTGK
jgi:hypothetical protein